MAWETRILVTENWQDLQNAYTNVTFTFQARRTDYSVNSWNNYGQAYWQIAAGGSSSGNNYFNINWRYGQNVWFTIASWTTSIKHNSDGTYSSYAEALCYTGLDNIGTLTARTNYTLTTIPRASSISSISGSTIGSNITVNIARQSSSFTHQVWWRINGTGSWTSLGTNFGTSCTFNLPMSVCNSVTQSTSCTLNIAIRAISNGSYVGGEVWSSKTVNVPSSVVPSFSSLSVTDTSRAKNLGIWVQGISTAACTINGASGSYGSWITSYRISTSAGHNIYSSSGTTGTINSSGNVTVTGTVTDSRGRTASKSVTISVQAYSTPRFNSYKIIRDSSKPTNVAVKASGSVSLLLNGSTQKNTLSYVIKYKQSSASAWTSVTAASGGTSFNTSRTLTNISSTRSYNFQLVLTDYFNSVTIPLSLSTSPTLADFKQAGVGIGKYHERGVLDVGGDAYISASLNVEGALVIPNAIKETCNVPLAGTLNNTGDLFGYFKGLPTFIGTNTQNNTWYNIISVRHRNGNGDGQSYGMMLYSHLTSSEGLRYRQQINGNWQGERFILDSANLGNYFTRRVVDSGVSGVWDWRQWDNGMVELWGTWTGTINLSQNNYSGFRYSNAITVNYPFRIVGPKLWVDRGPTEFMAGVRAFGDTETYARFTCYGHSDYSQSNVTVYLYAMGWR